MSDEDNCVNCDSACKQSTEGARFIKSDSISLGDNLMKPDKLWRISPSQADLRNCSGNDGVRQEGYSQKTSNLKQHKNLTHIAP